MTNKNILKGVASLVAVGALAAGGVALTSGGGGNSASASGNATASGSVPGAPRGSRPPSGSQPPGGPMMGTPVTGTAAAKAKSAALARYPGTVERVMRSPTGGYEVPVIKSDGSEVHVLVSSAFKVTGVETGGPPGAVPGMPS